MGEITIGDLTPEEQARLSREMMNSIKKNKPGKGWTGPAYTVDANIDMGNVKNKSFDGNWANKKDADYMREAVEKAGLGHRVTVRD